MDFNKGREGKTYRIEIIASKSKVAPLKTMTIPRLELCAASLLANLIKTVSPTFQKERVKTYGWTDSQIVLHWITKPSSNLRTYVANRVANIQTKSGEFSIDWKWIQGLQNPADLISRGTTALELREEAKWWQGPTWLKQDSNKWPEQPITPIIPREVDAEREFKTVHLTVNGGLTKGKWFKCDMQKQKTFPLLEAYSRWDKLLKVTSMLFRACHNFRKPQARQLGTLTKNEQQRAHNYLIQLDQTNVFRREIQTFKTTRTGTIGTLAVIWDPETELLRINGRIQSKNLTRDEQFPIIIPKEGDLGILLVRDAHEKTGHGGNQLMLQYLRTKYWLTGARQIAKNTTRQCPICFRYRMKTSEQLMAALPTIRTTPTRAFTRTGVDYAGPVMIRSALGRFPKLTKAYISVFVCLVTRAIHLELVSDETTEAFIEAFRRMVARRGLVAEMVSDNGRNFVGANNYLKTIIEEQQKRAPELEREFNLKWNFITPRAPHHGGIYEAAVKSVKHHLKRIIGETTLTFEKYSTILTQAEAFVNSRTISAISDDPTDLTVLTPGHFLVGEALVRIPDDSDYREVNPNRPNRWQHLQKMLQPFWDRWRDEYLGTLINRSKWTSEQTNLKVGDLVIEREDNTPPMKWKMARVPEVIPGKDGLVRTVVIRNSAGVYQRPITRLGRLHSTGEGEG